MSKFKGKVRVVIRKFYKVDSRELMPGKKGLSLSMEKYQKFKSLIPAIDAKLAKHK